MKSLFFKPNLTFVKKHGMLTITQKDGETVLYNTEENKVDIEKIKEIIVKRLEKHKNHLSMAIKDTRRLLDEIDIKLKLEESNEGKISYKDFNFICNCDPDHVGFLDVGNGAVEYTKGRVIFNIVLFSRSLSLTNQNINIFVFIG